MRVIANSEFGSHPAGPDATAPSGGMPSVLAPAGLAGLAGLPGTPSLAFAERPPPAESASEHESVPRSVRRKWDHFRFDPRFARRLVTLLEPILRLYFRGEVRGVENFSTRQSMLVANHDGGMLPIDGLLIGSAWHQRFDYSRPLGLLVHDMVLKLAGWLNRVGAVAADKHNLDAVLDSGHSLLVYPGGSRETFRSFWDRKRVTLGNRTGFVKHALRRDVPITPIVSAGAHETFFVLSRGGWLADRLGISKKFRADVFPLVAGLPFGLWFGALLPQLPLPAKVTVRVLPSMDLRKEVARVLGRPFRDSDVDDERIIQHCFTRVRDTMQDALTELYAERRLPVLG